MHKEHIHNNTVKNHLQCQHAEVTKDKSGTATAHGVTSEAATNLQDNSNFTGGKELECPAIGNVLTQESMKLFKASSRP